MDMENHKWDHKQEKKSCIKTYKSNGLFLTGITMINFVNDYFVNIATTLTGTLQDASEFICSSPPVVVSCFFNPACLSEVVNVISKLKN